MLPNYDKLMRPNIYKAEEQFRIDKEVEFSLILNLLEEEFDVKVLYACESGSRAWGFESQDSDYDIRFIYAHRPEWYMSIHEERDVIERSFYDLKYDVSGWDLRKALRLFHKSNPPLMEWLHSPIVYYEPCSLANKLRTLAKRYYSIPRACYHYLHMAKHNYKEYLRGDTVWTKKYFYVLRPILAVMWLRSGMGIVPVEFETLVNTLIQDQELLTAIHKLVVQKYVGHELRSGPRVPVINQFIEENMKFYTEYKMEMEAAERLPKEPLDNLLISTLEEIYYAK